MKRLKNEQAEITSSAAFVIGGLCVLLPVNLHVCDEQLICPVFVRNKHKRETDRGSVFWRESERDLCLTLLSV